jgi:transposase
MSRISNQNRAIAIGLLEAGTPVKQVARRMDVSPNAIRKLQQTFMDTGQVKDRPRSGRSKGTTHKEDRLVINRTLRRRTSTGNNTIVLHFIQFLDFHSFAGKEIQTGLRAANQQRVSVQTIRNRLHSAGLYASCLVIKKSILMIYGTEKLICDGQGHIHDRLGNSGRMSCSQTKCVRYIR